MFILFFPPCSKTLGPRPRAEGGLPPGSKRKPPGFQVVGFGGFGGLGMPQVWHLTGGSPFSRFRLPKSQVPSVPLNLGELHLFSLALARSKGRCRLKPSSNSWTLGEIQCQKDSQTNLPRDSRPPHPQPLRLKDGAFPPVWIRLSIVEGVPTNPERT